MTRPTPPPRSSRKKPREWNLHFSDVSGYGHYATFVVPAGEKCRHNCEIVRVREVLPRPRVRGGKKKVSK